MYIPDVKEIIHTNTKKGEVFTVMWTDDTSTTVKLAEGEQSDDYTAFVYALGKKLFGDKGRARRFISIKKNVFERRIERKKQEKERLRNQLAFQKALEEEDLPDISGIVYDEMFVAPCLISKAMFRRNR